MNHFESVHTTEIDGFVIELSVTPETDTPDWDFVSEEDRQDTLDRINNGYLLWFVAKVTASKLGIVLGTEYLGGCCYERISEFLNDPYFVDMVDQAIAEAKNNIQLLVEV